MNLTPMPAGLFDNTRIAFFEAGNTATIAAGPIAPEQIRLVRATWTYVAPMAEQAATLFFGRLFELDPAIKIMFAWSNLTVEKRKLMQTIGVAVKHLHRVEDVIPVVRDLGRRHACYGVQDRHYVTVAEALVWALGQGLGRRFTPEVENAWTATCNLLTEAMTEGAADPLDG